MKMMLDTHVKTSGLGERENPIAILKAARYRKLSQFDSDEIDKAYQEMVDEIIETFQNEINQSVFASDTGREVAGVHFETHFVDAGMVVTGYGTFAKPF